MQGRRLRRGAPLLLFLCACAGKTADPAKPQPPVERVFDVRGEANRVAPDGGVAKHIHTWEQIGIHPYQVMRGGVPDTELCVISRCSICGAIHHDCETRTRSR